MNRIIIVALFTLLCGCTTHLRPVPYSEGDLSVFVVEDGARHERVLKAGSAEAQRFARWVDQNAKGWHGYYATTPSNGVFVETRLGSLQFNRTGVIALRQEGLYWKAVSAEVYELLRGETGT